jgi:hypothetical protein
MGGQRDREILKERSATCKTCGLTARNQYELDDHVRHAHGSIGDFGFSKKKVYSSSSSEEQKIDPFPS